MCKKCLKWVAGAGLLLIVGATASSALAGVGPPPVPEIDPGSMASALALLAGGLLMLTGRRRSS